MYKNNIVDNEISKKKIVLNIPYSFFVLIRIKNYIYQYFSELINLSTFNYVRN